MAGGDRARLGALEWFSELPEDRLRLIENACDFKHVKKDAVILDQSEVTEEALFLLEGHARVVYLLEDGQEIKLASIKPLDVIGALSAVDRGPRSATVIADTPCLVAAMTRDQFIEVLRREPGVALHLLKRFSAIIRSLNTKVRDLSLLTPQQRVFVELLNIARQNDGAEAPLAVFEMPSHEALAERLNTTREVIAFAIGALARRRIVERKHKTLFIRDPETLRMLAQAQHSAD